MKGSMKRTHLAERPSRLSFLASSRFFSSTSWTSAVLLLRKRPKSDFLGAFGSWVACELKAAWSLMRHLARERSRRLGAAERLKVSWFAKRWQGRQCEPSERDAQEGETHHEDDQRGDDREDSLPKG